MKTTVFSSSLIVQEVKYVVLLYSFSWKEQVNEFGILPASQKTKRNKMEKRSQNCYLLASWSGIVNSPSGFNVALQLILTCRVVWCRSWSLRTPHCSSCFPCISRESCCSTLKPPSMQFCALELEIQNSSFFSSIVYGQQSGSPHSSLDVEDSFFSHNHPFSLSISSRISCVLQVLCLQSE